jgi:voltage-gated potassium channel Kch
MNINEKILAKNKLILLLFFIMIVFKPSPGMIIGSWVGKGITLAIMGASTFMCLYILYLKRDISDYKKNPVVIFGLLTVLSLLVSVIYGSIFFSEYTSLTDFIEVYRYLLYFSFFIIAKETMNFSINDIVKTALVFIFIVELFGVMQFYNIIDINNHIGLLYTSSESLYNMILMQHRIGSTFLNPNLYGSFIVIVISLLLSLLTFKYPVKWYFIYPLLLLTILSIFYTTSRTAVITIFGVIVYWIIITLITKADSFKGTLKNGLIVLALFILAAIILIPNINYLNYAKDQIVKNLDISLSFGDESNPEEDPSDETQENEKEEKENRIKKSVESVSSFKSRYHYWDLNMAQFKESPILGSGPMKDEFVRFADNAYIYTLARYGIVGLIILVGFYLYMYSRTAITVYRKNTSYAQKILSMTIHLTITGYFVMGIVAEIWFNIQSMTILFALFGLLYNKNIKDFGESK